MNYLILLKSLKDWLVTTIAWLWKNKSTVMIIVLLYIATVLQYERNDLEQELEHCAVEKELLIEQHESDLLELDVKHKNDEIKRLEREKEIEVRHSEQLSKMHIDYNAIIISNDRLSKQLTEATNKLQNADSDTVRAYASTTTELFRDCVGKYSGMGKIAQQHRLAEERAVNLYNNVFVEEDKIDKAE